MNRNKNNCVFSEDASVSLNGATFTWEANLSPSLVDINLHVPRGSLVAIVGKVGSGKSSLLSALCGELHKLSGNVGLSVILSFVIADLKFCFETASVCNS